MSWKNVKDHYQIGHIVFIDPANGICVGSGYIHDLIVIGLDGKLKKRYTSSPGINTDLTRYQSEMDADPAKLAELVAAPDTFKCAKEVYTWEGGDIVKRHCEEYGWPNVTHTGQIMYDNQYSTDVAKVVAWAKRDNAGGVEWRVKCMAEREDAHRKVMEELEEERARCAAALAKLNADYPEAAA